MPGRSFHEASTTCTCSSCKRHSLYPCQPTLTAFLMTTRYLNNQHIKKQKQSDAELTYGTLNMENSDPMKEIGELGLETWKRLVSDH